MKQILTLLCCLLLCTSCNDKNNAKSLEINSAPPRLEQSTRENAILEQSATYNLLQGIWVNVDDPRSSLIFEGSEVKNIYDDIAIDTKINFTIGDTCKNNSNPSGSEEKDKYISTLGDAQECYYILELSKDRLQVSFLGKGNTLTFTKG